MWFKLYLDHECDTLNLSSALLKKHNENTIQQFIKNSLKIGQIGASWLALLTKRHDTGHIDLLPK